MRDKIAYGLGRGFEFLIGVLEGWLSIKLMRLRHRFWLEPHQEVARTVVELRPGMLVEVGLCECGAVYDPFDLRWRYV